MVDLLDPVIAPYAWGSTRAIAEIQGRPVPSPGPEAELWIGAHPTAPSRLRRDDRPTTLDAVIAADPVHELGAEQVRRFGSRLPFLLKVLAAERALSIQVHPDRAQARAGFRAENERGLSPDDPGRNYVDEWAKPEIICALTPFEALAGFRDPVEAADLLDGLDLPELTPLTARLRTDHDRRAALDAILSWPTTERPSLLARAISAAKAISHLAPAYQVVGQTAADRPDDLGVLATLLLRHLVLAPGEALFMPAGGIHAYLCGVGVELLGNSDNVLRAGLTGKHVDVAELLRVVDPAVAVPLIEPTAIGGGTWVYECAAEQLRLYRVDLTGDPVPLPGSGPRLVLCLDGDAVLHAGSTLTLARGTAAFVSAADPAVTVAGHGTVYAAATG